MIYSKPNILQLAKKSVPLTSNFSPPPAEKQKKSADALESNQQDHDKNRANLTAPIVNEDNTDK